jgi:hypothetical protein
VLTQQHKINPNLVPVAPGELPHPVLTHFYSVNCHMANTNVIPNLKYIFAFWTYHRLGRVLTISQIHRRAQHQEEWDVLLLHKAAFANIVFSWLPPCSKLS